MKVTYITPTYFHESSIIGGGERYPIELATWISKYIETTLVSFSDKKRLSYRKDQLQVEIYPVQHFIGGNIANPLGLRYLESIFNTDIVHVHMINTVISDLACLTANFLNKRVFVTDHAGGGNLVLNRKIPVLWGYKGAIAQSQLAFERLPPVLQKKGILVKGGIDIERFCPEPFLTKENKILYVGRIVPHKGVNYLIESLRYLDDSNYQLKIIGRIYNELFYRDLKKMAVGLPVEFIHDADDSRLLNEYRTAKVTVLPSVHIDFYGSYTPVPELMGYTLLESQACGTPVICTDAGGMHEFVDNEQTGFVVEQNSEEAIALALKKILKLSPLELKDFQIRCRDWVQSLSWEVVGRKHLELYQKRGSTN